MGGGGGAGALGLGRLACTGFASLFRVQGSVQGSLWAV